MNFITGPIFKWGMIALLSGAVGYFAFVQIKSALLTWNQMNQNIGEYKQKELKNTNDIKGLNVLLEAKNKEFEDLQEKLKSNERNLIVITERYEDVAQTLQEHELNTLMVRKPGLMEGVYNRGTDKYYRVREEQRSAPYIYYSSPDRDVSPTIRTSAPKSAEIAVRQVGDTNSDRRGNW